MRLASIVCPAVSRTRGARTHQKTRLAPPAALRAALQAAMAPEKLLASLDAHKLRCPEGAPALEAPALEVAPPQPQSCSANSQEGMSLGLGMGPKQPPISPGCNLGSALPSNASSRMQTPVPPTTTMLGRDGSTAQVLVVHDSFVQGFTHMDPSVEPPAHTEPSVEPLAAQVSGTQGEVDAWLASRVASAASSVARKVSACRQSTTSESSTQGEVDAWLTSRVASAAASVARTPLQPLTQQSLPSTPGSPCSFQPSTVQPLPQSTPPLPPLPCVLHEDTSSTAAAAILPAHISALEWASPTQECPPELDCFPVHSCEHTPAHSSRASSAARQAATDAVLEALVEGAVAPYRVGSAAPPSPGPIVAANPMHIVAAPLAHSNSTASLVSSVASDTYTGLYGCPTMSLESSTASMSVLATVSSGLSVSEGPADTCPPASSDHYVETCVRLGDSVASTPARAASISSSVWSVHAAAAAAVLADVVEGLSSCSTPHATGHAVEEARVATPETPGGLAARAVLEGLVTSVVAERL